MLTRLLIIFCVLITTKLTAQEFRFRNYRVEQGLPSDVIKAISQDSLGFIWIATDDGLVKYDGLGFTPYKLALQNQHVKEFLNTRNGRLLMMGERDLIEIQNLVDTVIFKTLVRGNKNVTDTSLWSPKSLYEDRKGNIWIAEPHGVVRYNDSSFKRFNFGSENRAFAFTRSYNFFEDAEGVLYAVAYAGKIYRYDTAANTFIELEKKLPEQTKHVAFDGSKLLIAAHDGLYEASFALGELTKLTRVLPILEATYVLNTVDHQTWVGTANEDVYKVMGKNYSSLKTLLYNFNGVNGMYTSREGDLWIATNKGIVLVQKNQFTIADVDTPPTLIKSIAYDAKHDHVYYCHEEALIKLFRNKNDQWENKILYNEAGSYFQSLLFGKQRLWASNAFDIQLYEKGELKKQWDFSNDGNFIHDLFLDSHQNVWISQARSSQLKVITDALIVQYVDLPAGKQSEIKLVREGSRGIYAVCNGTSTYLFLKAPNASAFKNISLPLDFKPISDLILTDLGIQKGVLWLGTSEGLLRYDHKTVKRVDLGGPMSAFAVRAIEVLDNRTILFANSHGLIRYDVVTGNHWLYDENSGLPSNTISAQGIFIDSLKRVWVGTSSGLAWASNPMKNQLTQKPFCVGAQVNGKSVKYMKGLEAAYGSFINLQFSPISFPENKINFQFRMNDETEWRPFENSEVSLSRLSAGKHFLLVRARKNPGFGWSKSTQVTIIIGKPFWQKAEFIFSVLLLGLIIAWISYATSARLMKKRREQLQKLVAQRTHDLQKANDELLIRNTELDRFVYSTSHDLSAPLKSILGLIMVARLDTSIENQEQYLGRMESSVRKLEEFIEEVVSYSRNSRMPIKHETFFFEAFVKNTLLDHQYSPNFNNIEFIVECPTDECITTDVTRLKIILNNLLSNAIKFHSPENSPTCFVKIKLTASASHYTIVVEDNGCGIEQKHLAHIFDMFYRANEQSQGSGLGLYILKESILKLGGTVEAQSKINQGTSFIISLPILEKD